MGQAIEEDYRTYPSFNHFFTRALKPELRPVINDQLKIACPVDGAISQIGYIEQGNLFQAKGRDYLLQSLIASEGELTRRFETGAFATLYLSPKDYHRIHMPLSGQLERMIYVPGDLFPVNNASVNNVENVFARNERVITIFNTDIGKVALILVGALFVGSMETVWAGQITPTKNRCIQAQQYSQDEVKLDKGEEMGRFNMGSTVILLFEPNNITWKKGLSANDTILMGEELATIIADPG